MNGQREVALAGRGRSSLLAAVFGRAFVDEPMMRWPLGTDGDVVDRFTRCFAAFLEQALDLGVVWEVGAAQGAAVWVPPTGFGAVAADPWDQAQIRAMADDGGERYHAFWEWVNSRVPREPVWLLDSIAVEPAFQGRGFGRALIAEGLGRAGAAGVGAFLSTGTPGNVAIYGRCGFRVGEDLDAPDGGPHVWFMRWDKAA